MLTIDNIINIIIAACMIIGLIKPNKQKQSFITLNLFCKN